MTARQLQNAAIKLERAQAAGGIDPETGYTAQQIADYILIGAEERETLPDTVDRATALVRKAMTVDATA